MLQKIKHLLQRFGTCCREYPADRREFGGKVAAAKFWDVLIPTGKSKRYINTISSYMCKEMAPLLQRYAGVQTSVYPTERMEKTPVWVCWWQGEETMPPVVKACINKMHNLLSKTAQLHVISWTNLDKYIELPAHVLEKHRQGTISAAHLSDVLRFGLLSRYGGVWLDATVYLSKDIPSKALTEPFFTQRFSDWESCPQEACRGKWCGFFLGGKAGNVLFTYMYEALADLWKHHDRVVDYVFFDYILWAGYCGVPAIRETIDVVPAGNENIWLLAKHLNDAYTPEKYAELLATNDFFKLSYKGKLMMTTPEGVPTVYAHILAENNIT